MKKGDTERIWADATAFRRQVRMPAVQVEGLSDDELSVALAYEVEPLSAISADAAEVAFRVVSGDDPAVRVFEVAVVRRTARSAGAGMAKVRLAAVVVAVLALAAAAVDALRIASEERALARDVEMRSRLDVQLKELKREADAARREIDQLRAARVEAARAQQNAEVLRKVHLELMDAVAAAFGEAAVLKTLDGAERPYAARIEAVSVTPQAASEAMVSLTRALAPKGWKVEPGALKTEVDGGATTFSCGVVFDDGGEFK